MSARERPGRDHPAREPRGARPASGNRPTPRRSGTGGAQGRRSGAAAPRPQTRKSRSVAPAGPSLVVGTTPALARATGGLLVLAGLLGVASLFPTYLVVDGQETQLAAGLAGVLSALVVPLTSIAVGTLLAAGRLPKFGLAHAGVAGALALGGLFIELYNGSESTDRAGREVVAGEWLVTSTVDRGAGWWLGVLGLACLVLAGGCALAAWGRTVMDDDGALDPFRPGLAGLAAALGVGTVLCLAVPSVGLPELLETDPRTLEQSVIEQQGPEALYGRPGWALLGGLLLAGAILLCSVLAPSLRPRLAAVGALLAITATVLAAGLAGIRDAGAAELEWTLPGVGLLLLGFAYAGATVLTWRLRRR
ncbi:hypothetical protein [Trujillonella endophytica]|uniref:Uncharacterized protein n=1 Tax=Trujillonella endophytica TaxID=673521 RepID=A0A1H8RRB3_9ACTN|nr:hypothetical protein [Trujillella endophytica]SEO68714.1 hypothetical protein SAMN05660991_01272 [Trujillella endophytica]